MTLLHREQAGQAGCLYHAAYALTGDEALLEHADDLSEPRFIVRLAALGLLAVPFWVTPPTGPPTTGEFWAGLRAHFAVGAPGAELAPLLVTIPGTAPPWQHTVALTLPLTDAGEVEVSDSNAAHVFALSWSAFLASDYARAHRVEMLGPLELDAYPPRRAQDA